MIIPLQQPKGNPPAVCLATASYGLLLLLVRDSRSLLLMHGLLSIKCM